MITLDSESIMVNIANKIESSANESNQWQSKQIYPDNITGTENLTGHDFSVVGARENNEIVSYHSVSIQKMSKKSNSSKQGRKRKIDSLTMEAVEKPIDQAAKSLGVSRSTLKRVCRDHGMPSWPLPKHSKKAVHTTDLKLSPKAWTKQNLQWPSNTRFGLAFVVFLMVRVKRWRNKKSLRNSLCNGDHPAVSESTAKPKYTINNIIP